MKQQPGYLTESFTRALSAPVVSQERTVARTAESRKPSQGQTLT